MTPHYADDWLTVYAGDALTVLRDLDASSVHCVVTSPPYWGLRDYGSDGQLGLEATPEQYVANLVGVFRELRRVLKPTGTAWLNLGDSYANTGKSGGGDQGARAENGAGAPTAARDGEWKNFRPAPPGLKPKDLVGIPWRVAFALQADGWYLRSDIIWAKPNPMPESVTDRPTKAHEYLFLLSKSARYFYDADAVAERALYAGGVLESGYAPPGQSPHNGSRREAKKRGDFNGKTEAMPGRNAFRAITATRNLRSVWTIATRPYPGAHFAVFPPELPERCIKAGCPEGGVVLDPFAGSGTVGLVANRLSRRAVLIDLNPAYIEQQMQRNAQVPVGL